MEQKSESKCALKIKSCIKIGVVFPPAIVTDKKFCLTSLFVQVPLCQMSRGNMSPRPSLFFSTAEMFRERGIWEGIQVSLFSSTSV